MYALNQKQGVYSISKKTILSPKMYRLLSLFFLIIISAVSGCALIELKDEVNKSLESTVVVGQVSDSSPGKGPIIVAACRVDRGKKEVEHYTVLHESGEYELLVAKGSYHVFAYRDTNSNLIYEKGEPAGQYTTPTVISAPAGGVVLEIDFSIEDNKSRIDLPFGFTISSKKPQKLHSRLAGTIMDLDDPLFSPEYGKKGYWEPLTFYREVGGSIYFLEEYDPEKIPILFIHGAAGTPGDWKYFVENIDRSRFQPWFFYYPSGARIKSMSYLMLWKLSNLYYKYRFEKLYLTAHSMGGMVARSFIMDYGKSFPNLELFISLATPWGGDNMAEYGVNQSPAVIPCWIDMQPNSPFIHSLFSAKLPENIYFYQFYGFRGNRNPFQSNNDGTITLSSLLDNRSQSEAKMNYGFNEDHITILSSDKVVAQYNSIISTYESQNNAARSRSEGYLNIHLSDYNHISSTTHVDLILDSLDKKISETVLSFYPDGDVTKLGPFPPGDYTASVIAPAAETEKKFIPVSITADTTNEINFRFKPDGEISGFVTVALNPEDRSVGMPQTAYLPRGKEISLQSIALRGNGIHRILHPLDHVPDNFWEFYVSRTDFCYKTSFNFFGLPAGEYQLEVKAQGYVPYVQKHTVTPGKSRYLYITELQPEKK